MLGNELNFTAPQLQAQLDRRFPRDYEKLGGLVTLRVMQTFCLSAASCPCGQLSAWA